MANISHSNRNSQHSFIIGQRVLQLSVCFSSLYPLSFSLPNLPFRRGEIIVLASQHFICFFFLHVTEEIKNRNLCNSIAILSFLVEQNSLVLICDILNHPDLDSSRRLSSPIKVNGFTLILITITCRTRAESSKYCDVEAFQLPSCTEMPQNIQFNRFTRCSDIQ